MSGFRLENVTFKYGDDSKVVLKNINLNIEDGEFLCVLGKSGCGKSTLLKLFAGLLFPTNGEVYFNNKKIVKAGLDRGVVFQDYGLFPWMNVGGNIMLALKQKYKDKSARELKEIGLKYTKKVGLEDNVFNLLPNKLSGGMKQRVAIAQALCVDPDVLLMDEPFGALDAVTRAKLQDLVVELYNESTKKKTVIFITHDVDEAMLLASRIIILGQSPSEIIYDKKISQDEKIFRGSSQINEKAINLRNELINVINKDVNLYV